MATRVTRDEAESLRNRTPVYSCYSCAKASRIPIVLTGEELVYEDESVIEVHDTKCSCDHSEDTVNYCCPKGDKLVTDVCKKCKHATPHEFVVKNDSFKSPDRDSSNMTVSHTLYKCGFEHRKGVYSRGYYSCDKFKPKGPEPNGKTYR